MEYIKRSCASSCVPELSLGAGTRARTSLPLAAERRPLETL